MKISVFGLGYVGAVSAACFADMGHEVIGVDIIREKVDAINKGKVLLKEKGLDFLIKKNVEKGRLRATTNPIKAILETDMTFICVGTPSKKNGDIDLTALKKTCEKIGKILKEKRYHAIVIRSTIFPGTAKIIEDILEENSGKRAGLDFELAISPEFLREGSAIKDFFYPPCIVIGAESKDFGKRVMKVYSKIKSKKFIVDESTAQMIKYASNSWHALKVVFANEIAALCKDYGVDSKRLMALFSEDKQLNISPYYLKPGFAYGGSCLPKEVAVINNRAKKSKEKLHLLESIPKSNMEQINRAIRLIESKKKKTIGILGITFKADTDDIRGNPILLVINKLLSKGYKIKIFDRLVNKSNLDNITKSYRKEVYDLISRENLKDKINDISELFSNLEEVLNQDIIIISNRDESLEKFIRNLKEKQILIDLQKIFKRKYCKAEYDTL
jgi:GDP-mannose 6-dehydrogenase